jgi:hypothetical protein
LLTPRQKTPTESNAIAMPARATAASGCLQEIAGERQSIAAMCGRRVNEMVSANAGHPLAEPEFELAHALHSNLQELEFRDYK